MPTLWLHVFPGKGASTDSLGIFRIEQIPPGIYRFEATLIGYKSAVTSEYLVSASTPFIEIEIEEDENMLSAIVVTPSPFRKTVESPVSMRIIGLQEIEKSPGGTAISHASCEPIRVSLSLPSVIETT